MNEVAAAGNETSVLTMFLHASIVVKLVMIGLLSASVWCWAIIINKTLLIRRARAAIEEFETVFWSGNSLEDLYQSLAAAPHSGDRLPVCCGNARMETLFSVRRSLLRGTAIAHRKSAGCLHRPRGGKARSQSAGARDGRIRRPLYWPVRHRLGHHDVLPLDRGIEEYLACGGGAGHRRGLFATAIGLFAAIPALIAYNKLSGDVAKTQAKMEAFADEFSAILSRQIDQHAVARRMRRS